MKLSNRKQTDATFARMAEDAGYQKEAKLVAEEFSQSDWEAFEQCTQGGGLGNNFQRVGSISNTHVGREFQEEARLFFAKMGISLQPEFGAPVGYKVKKSHKFDLGSEEPPILVECKSYTWTTGGNSPSAKIRGLNEVMLLFSVAPDHYRKILFVLKHLRNDVTLIAHYIKTQGHLIGPNIEIWEFDLDEKRGERVF
jgi:hypothetical protein